MTTLEKPPLGLNNIWARVFTTEDEAWGAIEKVFGPNGGGGSGYELAVLTTTAGFRVADLS
jgi:hypothetical protein